MCNRAELEDMHLRAKRLKTQQEQANFAAKQLTVGLGMVLRGATNLGTIGSLGRHTTTSSCKTIMVRGLNHVRYAIQVFVDVLDWDIAWKELLATHMKNAPESLKIEPDGRRGTYMEQWPIDMIPVALLVDTKINDIFELESHSKEIYITDVVSDLAMLYFATGYFGQWIERDVSDEVLWSEPKAVPS